MNKVIETNMYIGKKGIDLKFTQGKGTAVANYSLSAPKEFNADGKKEYNFFNCVTWGKQAEWLANNAHRIKKVNISGRLETRNYDAADGHKVYITEIVTDHVEVAEWNNEESEPKVNTGFTEVENDDTDSIPF
jgi:single-strand DNA-binding protein